MVLRRLIGRIFAGEILVKVAENEVEKARALEIIRQRLGKIAHRSAKSLAETDPVYVATKNGKVIGSLFLMQTGDHLNAEYLATSRWYERQGVARKLVEKTFEHARENSFKVINFRAKKKLMPVYRKIAQANDLNVEESRGLFHYFGKIKL